MSMCKHRSKRMHGGQVREGPPGQPQRAPGRRAGSRAKERVQMIDDRPWDDREDGMGPTGATFGSEHAAGTAERGRTRDGRGGGLQDSHRQLLEGGGQEGGVPRRALVQQAAQGPHICGRGVQGPVPEQLGGHVAGAALLPRLHRGGLGRAGMAFQNAGDATGTAGEGQPCMPCMGSADSRLGGTWGTEFIVLDSAGPGAR